MKALNLEPRYPTRTSLNAYAAVRSSLRGRKTAPYAVDLDRLVWDTEYRDEFQKTTKTDE